MRFVVGAAAAAAIIVDMFTRASFLFFISSVLSCSYNSKERVASAYAQMALTGRH